MEIYDLSSTNWTWDGASASEDGNTGPGAQDDYWSGTATSTAIWSQIESALENNSQEVLSITQDEGPIAGWAILDDDQVEDLVVPQYFLIIEGSVTGYGQWTESPETFDFTDTGDTASELWGNLWNDVDFENELRLYTVTWTHHEAELIAEASFDGPRWRTSRRSRRSGKAAGTRALGPGLPRFAPSVPTPLPVPMLVEIRSGPGASALDVLGLVSSADSSLARTGFRVDGDFAPVPMGRSGAAVFDLGPAEETHLVRGHLTPRDRARLAAHPLVVGSWVDEVIAPHWRTHAGEATPAVSDRFAPSTAARGTLAQVAQRLGAAALWERGYRGRGVIVGIVGGGILAKGRVRGGLIPNVRGGWPIQNWGRVENWDGHGLAMAYDALGLAPEATLYDIRLPQEPDVNRALLSRALQAYDWVLGLPPARRPHILSNSWGLHHPDDAPRYAQDPTYPFTRKVAEVVREGITVLFSAGDTPGPKIWGANGSPPVITVGAANVDFELFAYSSSGPAALSPRKPDLCGMADFKGFCQTGAGDSGTSAACAVLAGGCALLIEARRSLAAGEPLTPVELKAILRATATQIWGGPGWNRHSGYGVVDFAQAFARL